MASSKTLFLLILFALDCFAQENSVVFETQSGRIKGKIVQKSGKNFGVFQAIPYAEPPLGSKRFKDPIAKKVWSPETLDASRGYGSPCPQQQSHWTYDDMSEDCLTLNVFTPKNSSGQNAKYPVMLFIHGGAFRLGSAVNSPEDGILGCFVDRSVVFVSINYRLGPLGFWTTRSCAVKGNMGLKDQRMALLWVRDHISAFGGDPAEVTIFGESAGSVSCDMLTLSPTTKGLFSQAIMQSISALANGWVMKPGKDEKSVRLARALGCLPAEGTLGNCQQDLQVLECMQGKDADQMVNVLQDSNSDLDLTDLFTAVTGDDFFPEDLETLADARGPMNVMLGTCRDEWGLFEIQSPQTQTPEQLQSQIPRWLKVFGAKSLQAASAAVKFEYVDSQLHNPDASKGSFWFNQATQMKTAIATTAPLYQDALEFLDERSKVYLYSFDYLSDSVMSGGEWRGILHSTELTYQFNKSTEGGAPFNMMGPYPLSPSDYRIQDLFSLLWTNFAKYGNPTPQSVQGVVWEPLNKSKANYLSINNPPEMKTGYNWRDIAFWNGLIKELDQPDSSQGGKNRKKQGSGVLDALVRFFRSILNKF